MPTISLTIAPHNRSVSGTKATFDVGLQGFTVGDTLDLSFVEKADGNQASDRVLGIADGRVAAVAGRSSTPRFTMVPSAPPPAAPSSGALVAFRFPGPVMADGSSGSESVYVFEIFGDRIDVHEGDWWEFCIQCDSLNLSSRRVPVARIRRQLQSWVCAYDWHDGNTVRFYNDGSTNEHGTSGAFKDMLDAIDQAQHFIFIADWSFQPMFCPTHGPTMADTIGRKLIAKAANMLVAIHTWDHTNIAAADDQNDSGDDVLDEQAGGTRPAQLLWRASSHDQTGMSHHQKYVLLDCPGPNGRRDLKAFFGGLDLTAGRFDWGAHPILPADPTCAKFRTSLTLDGTSYNDWYNAEFGGDMNMPRQPWHDIHGMIQGPAAWDFVREFVGRWNVDPSWVDAMGDDGNDDIRAVLRVFRDLFNSARFVQQWEPHSGPWSGQVIRSMFRSHWAEFEATNTPARRGTNREFQWRLRGGFERSIQMAYRQAIDQAEKYIYIETQYLIGSGRHWDPARNTVANNLPERIVERINSRIRDGVSFHAYIVVPMFPEGVPNGVAAVAQRLFEWRTMRYMAQAVFAVASARGKDWRDYLSFCFLANWNTVAAPRTTGTRAERVRANQRYMVYVHSKLIMIDDRYVLFGSANLNERSLAGDRDLEIGCAMWPSRGREQDCENQARSFRRALWTEHFGSLPSGWQNAESPACIASVRAKGLSNYINMRQLNRVAGSGHLCIWPFHADASAFYVESVSGAPEGDSFMPDSVYNQGSMAS
ncbi:MAG TPA: phospholipase D-like domain-containing protein, partial [Enhygromyxa sp.]|nr:phospholipase D-like domain-containing protein [Enhygromyxa sp.]